jgi:steroid 5-alpha reductase family enzyme
MITTLLVLFIAYILLFLLSIRLRDNSIADVFWGVGFMIIALWSFYFSPKEIPQYLLTWLILLWGLRISTHIGKRKWKEQKEDPRYAKWREEWGSGWYFYARSFLQVYMLQMILMLLVALPILINGVISADAGIQVSFAGFRDKPGMTEQLLLVIWWFKAFFWLLIEMIADYQLAQFIKIKKPGEIFTTGLYRYSRHPNYFGESMFWLGISMIGLSYSYFAIIGWLVITFLLLFVSGVPLQEARYAGRPNWEAYKKKTSVFIPWFPKK